MFGRVRCRGAAAGGRGRTRPHGGATPHASTPPTRRRLRPAVLRCRNTPSCRSPPLPSAGIEHLPRSPLPCLTAGLTLPTLARYSATHRGSLSHLPSVSLEQSPHVPPSNCDSAIIPIQGLDSIVPIFYLCRDGEKNPLRSIPPHPERPLPCPPPMQRSAPQNCGSLSTLPRVTTSAKKILRQPRTSGLSLSALQSIATTTAQQRSTHVFAVGSQTTPQSPSSTFGQHHCKSSFQTCFRGTIPRPHCGLSSRPQRTGFPPLPNSGKEHLRPQLSSVVPTTSQRPMISSPSLLRPSWPMFPRFGCAAWRGMERSHPVV